MSASGARPLAASPTQPRPAPMPSLSQGFDDFSSGRYNEHSGYPQMQSQRPADYMVGSNGASQYPDLPTPYPGQPLNGQNYDAYQSSASLPSIREMPDRRESMLGSQANNGAVRTPFYQGDNLDHFPALTPGSEHGSYSSRRSSFYDPNTRSHTSYPTLGSGQATPTGDFSRYGQAPYEGAPRDYRSLYGDVDYPPQPASGAQQANFGVLGDSNDPRSKRRRGNLPKQVTDILRAWFHEHLDHPYPTEEDKQMFIARTGLSISQVCPGSAQRMTSHNVLTKSAID
jgi:Homeobox KN domain